MKDVNFNFAKQQVITNSASGVDVVSTNVFDAGEAKKVFEGFSEIDFCAEFTGVSGTTPAWRARLVAADDAALTTNPLILADTGVIAAIVAGDLPIIKRLKAAGQRTAKRYYGVMFTATGHATDNDCVANAFCSVAGGQQTNLRP